MTQELIRFLDAGTKLVEDTISMGPLPLRVTCYLSDSPPPMEYVSSVRAIVFQDHSVLVIKEPDGRVNITPGGQVEKGETMAETLKRELLEETGWTLSRLRLLGFIHLHHLGPKPENYKYMFPDFIWPIYRAEADRFVPDKMIPDRYVSTSSFEPVEEVNKLPLNKGELLFLEAALKVR